MATKYISFEGLFENNVLGIFPIIRGFANLKDLAQISTPFLMEKNVSDGQLEGHQRKIDPIHAQRIKTYLEKSDNRFLPEVILSIRSTFTHVFNKIQTPVGVLISGENGIWIKRKWNLQSNKVHTISIERNQLDSIIQNKLIRRIDGNHRLALADQLQDDPSLPNKYLASFCFILLDPPNEPADDYSESLIFHTINSKALPLESEHALQLILGQKPGYAMKPNDEFSYDPTLYLTRLLRDKLKQLPVPAQQRIGNKPLTVLGRAASSMISMDVNLSTDLMRLNGFASDIFAGLNDVITRLSNQQPELCKAEYFLDLAARVWKNDEEIEYEQHVNHTIEYLDSFGDWIGKDGITSLKLNSPLSEQLFKTFESVRNRKPKQIFLARWYPKDSDGENKRRAQLRLEQIESALRQLESEDRIHLKLIDMGTEEGGTTLIHPKMYQAIESSDIILIDLTGIRPNVCIEAGYALKHHQNNRLLFIHEKGNGLPDVPFDLSTFRYEQFDQAAEIPSKINLHIKSIINSI